MTKREKLLAKLERNPRGVSLQDFETLINQCGYIKSSGSHPKARIGNATMPYKRENPVKSCYVKELFEIIKSLEQK